MTESLTPTQVEGFLRGVQPHVSPVVHARLAALAQELDSNGRLSMARALDLAVPPGADSKRQDTFLKFRKELASTTAAAGIDFRLVVDNRKRPPVERVCWFEGSASIDAELAALSSAAAARGTGNELVAPTAIRLAGPTYVYVSSTPRRHSPHDHSVVEAFVSDLASALGSIGGRRFALVDSSAVPIGEQPEQWRAERCGEADLRVALVSPHYFIAGGAERDEVLRDRTRVVATALSRLPDGPADFAGLERHDILNRDQPLDRVLRERRDNYIQGVVDAILRVADKLAGEASEPAALSDEPFVHHTLRVLSARTSDPLAHYVDPRAESTALDRFLAGPGQRGAHRSGSVKVVEFLAAWASDPSAPTHCALLGDVGMGKTTTTRLLTQSLLQRRTTGAPLPLLFDLRDLRPADLKGGAEEFGSLTLLHIVNLLLGASVSPGRPVDARQVVERIHSGGCLVIFDGLDEVLVHLEPRDQQAFTRQLWRVVESGQGASPSKLMLTCRTQFFRTIADQGTHFAGQHRDGPRGRDFVSLRMLPFDADQVREYLVSNIAVDGERADQIIDMLAGIHDLTELSHRPLTLRMLAEQVESIEERIHTTGRVRTIDLYDEVVERWLSRDEGKHRLQRDHKELLMEHLAARLWHERLNSWTPAHLEQWLLEFMASRPDLMLHYGQSPPTPDEWKSDLRTATFVSRGDDDTFSFAHRSLFEYFLARYLFRALSATSFVDVAACWSLPVPSEETLDFLGQALERCDELERDRARSVLRSLVTTPASPATLLAFAYVLHATAAGQPACSLVRADLTGADLRGWSISGAEGVPRLQMRGAILNDARLRGANLERVDLTATCFRGSDLSLAEFRDCLLQDASLDGAKLHGTILRHCRVRGMSTTGADTYRPQALWCEPTAELPPGWLIAPAKVPNKAGPRPSLKVRAAHHGWVTSAVFSPDGSRLASTGSDGSIGFWDASTGEQVLRLRGHAGRGLSAAYSPDGSRLATAGDFGSISVWDATTGRHILACTGHTGQVASVVFSPDGSLLATAGDDWSVRVWDAETGEQTLRFTGHLGPVASVVFSPDGRRLATAGYHRAILVWDSATGERVLACAGPTGWVRSVTFSPDGAWLASAGDDGWIRLWDGGTGEQILAWSARAGGVRSVAFSPDGTQLASASDDGSILVWDAATGEQVLRTPGHTGAVASVTFNPDGTQLCSASDDGSILVWDAATGEQVLALLVHTGAVASVAFSPDGEHLATAGHDQSVWVWDAATGEQVLACGGRTNVAASVAFSPDSRRLASAGDDRSIRVWDATTGEQVLSLTGHTGWVRTVAFSPDNTRLASAGDDRSIRVWDATTGAQVQSFTGNADRLTSVAFSPDGSRLASAGAQGTVRVWDATTGDQRLACTRHSGWVRSIAFSPDGSRLASAGDYGAIRVWDARTGEQVVACTGHTGRVTSVVFRRDGTHLASTGDDGSVRVWEAATGRQVAKCAGHTSRVASVVYSPDGTHLASAGDDGTIRVWDAASGRAVGWLVQYLGRDEVSRWDAGGDHLLAASPGAWRWLGYPVVIEGRASLLPAEHYGALPGWP